MDVVACTFLISRLSFSKSYTLRNLQGDDTEVPVIPTIGEEVTSKGTKKATLRGPGVDERYGSLLYLMEPTRSITFAVSATLRIWKYLSLPFSITISIREFPTLFASIHALFMRVISLIVSNYSSFFFISVILILSWAIGLFIYNAGGVSFLKISVYFLIYRFVPQTTGVT